mgnify:CR=1 FL=1
MSHGEELRTITDTFLEQNPNGLLLCEGIDDGLFGTIDGLSSKYPLQCIELPCSENASVGMALGAACYGLLPILCYQRVEFALLALEQLFNNTTKISYLSSGSRSNPALFRFIIGRGWGQGPSHSQSLEGLFQQIPEINLFMPVFPEDSHFIIKYFPSQLAPTISLEHRWVHYAERSGISVRKAAPYVIKSGKDLTIIASSYNVLLALRVADCAKDIGIEIEVVNLLTIQFNAELTAVIDSIQKTGRVIFLELAHAWNGISNQYVSKLYQLGLTLDAPPIIIGCKQSFSPSSFRLAGQYYLNCMDVGSAIAQTLGLNKDERSRLMNLCESVDKKSPCDQPSPSFKGPF